MPSNAFIIKKSPVSARTFFKHPYQSQAFVLATQQQQSQPPKRFENNGVASYLLPARIAGGIDRSSPKSPERSGISVSSEF